MLTLEPSQFSVQSQRDPTRALIALSGELDLASEPAARAELESALGAEELVIDLSRLSFMDVAGVRLLLAARNACRAAGHRLLVVRGSAPVHRVLVLCELAQAFEFADAPA